MMNDLGLGIVVSMKDAFSNNAARIQSSMLSLDQSVAAASERMTRNLDRIQKGTMMIGAGLSMLAVPAGLVASTAATQRSLAELSSLGVKDLKALEDAAEAFTNKWAGGTKADFLTAAYDVRSALAGLSDEAVGTFASMAALTGKATKATTGEMVGTFTTAYGIFKPIMADMSDIQWAEAFSGGLAQTVAAFKTNGKEMADAIKNIGAVGAASNIPLQEQLAILGQLQTTMPGSEAGTLYKAFVMKAAEAGKEMGLNFVDAGGRLKSVIPILEEVKGKFPDLSQAAAQVEIKKAFGSDEAVKFILQMSQGMDALKGNIEGVGKAMKQGTVLTLDMARAMNSDIGSQFGLVGQQVQNLAEILGATLLPVVIPLLQGVGRVVMAAQDVARRVPGITRAVLLLSAAVGAILVVVGAVVAAVGTVGVMVPAIQAGFVALSAGAAGAGTAIATWFLPVVAVIAGVVLAVILMKRAWETNFGGIRDFVLGAFDRVKMVFEGIRQLIGSLSSGTGQLSADLAQKLQDAGLLGFVVTFFRVYYRVREYLTALWGAFSASFGKVRAVVEPAVRALLDAYAQLGRAFLSVFEAFGSASGMVDTSVFRMMGQAVGSLLGALLTVGAYIVRFLVFNLVLTVRVIIPVIRLVAWLGVALVSAFVTGAHAAMKFFLPLRMLIEAVKHVGRVVGIVWRVLNGEMTLGEGIRAAGQSMVRFLATPLLWVRDVAAATWRGLGAGIAGIDAMIRRAGAALLGGLLALPIVGVISSIIGEVRAILGGQRSFADAGRNILMAVGRGLLAGATLPLRIVAGLGRRLLGAIGIGGRGPERIGRTLLSGIGRGMLALAALPGRVLLSALAGLSAVGSRAVGRLSDLGGVFLRVLSAPFRMLVGIASAAWDGLIRIVMAGWQRLAALGQAAMVMLGTPFRWLLAVAAAAWAGIVAIAGGYWQQLVALGSGALSFLAAPFAWLVGLASGAWEAIFAGGALLFGRLGALVTGWWDQAKGIFSVIQSVAGAVFGESGPPVAQSAVPASAPQIAPEATAAPMLPAPPVPSSVIASPAPMLPPMPSPVFPALAVPQPAPGVETPVVGVAREAEQAVIRMMAALVNVLQAAHEKIRSMTGSATPRERIVPTAMRIPNPPVAAPTVGSVPVVRAVRPVPPVVSPEASRRTAVPPQPRIAPVTSGFVPTAALVQQPAPLPAPVAGAAVAPAVPKRVPVESKAVWGRPSTVTGNVPALQDIGLRGAATPRRVKGAVQSTRGEWERIGKNAGKVPFEDTALAAIQSFKRIKSVVHSTRRDIGTISGGIGKAAASPGEAMRKTASTAVKEGVERLPPAEIKPMPGIGIRLDRAGLGKALGGVFAPRRQPTRAPMPSSGGVDAAKGLLAASAVAGLVAASAPQPAAIPDEPKSVGQTQQVAVAPALDPTRAALLADTRGSSAAPTLATNSSGATPAGDPVPGLLQTLIGKVDALADRPVDLTVTTKLNGREIAQAVYKDLRERKIRNYETL